MAEAEATDEAMDEGQSPQTAIELQRSFSAMNEEAGTPWGGGVEGLTVRVGLLGNDLDNLREGCQKLVLESEEIAQAIFERLGILHCRTARIEAALGLPPWQPPDEEESGMQPDGETGETGVKCLRGHALEPEEEVDGPPKQCGFCKCSRQTHYRCSEGCYFHACQECVQGKCSHEGLDPTEEQSEHECDAKTNEEPEDRPEERPEDGRDMRKSDSSQSGRSPSNTSEEDLPRQDHRSSKCSSRPQTPSTALPEDGTESSSRMEVDSINGAEEEAEPQAARRPPKAEGGLKARLCSLEVEVRELAASAATFAAKEAAQVAQEAAVACCAELQEDIARMSAALEASFGKAQGGDQPELKTELSRCEAHFQQQLEDFGEAMQQQLLQHAETCHSLRGFQEQSEARLGEKVAASMETVQGLAQRLELLEGDLPRGRVRASKNGRPEAAPEAETLRGLAGGFSALVKCLGLSQGDLGRDVPWEEVEHRLLEAWLSRTKEVWSLGLPPKPDLFDFLAATANPAQARPTGPAPRLPDRREAARLAHRLSSTSPGSCGTLSYSPQSSADARTELESEASPSPMRGAATFHLGAGTAGSAPRNRGKGADMAWTDRDPADGRPRAQSSGAAQRFREVLLGRA
mmetsp:Transcript_34427/g.82580  ORF Transcript_34427/g.82580 Transcript_34427/m.82580 type:complete len:633 (-) Transcript_34427:63-1961(-)